MTWTNHRIETAKAMWLDGHSASDIAKKIGQVTRNAVLGKMHRLGLARNEPKLLRGEVMKPPKRLNRPVFFANPGSNFTTVPVAPTQVPEVASLTQRPWITRLPGECARPTGGEGADTLSCCAPTGDVTTPYCAPCQRLMRVPGSGKKPKVSRRERDQGLVHVPINLWAA